MAKKVTSLFGAVAISSLLLVASQAGLASASVVNPIILPGFVKCIPAHGVWNGLISFQPPLMNGGTATTETIVVKATLGNTGNLCAASTGIAVVGAISGILAYNIAGANNCATLFSGIAITPLAAASKLTMTWSVPAGSAATKWMQPGNFKLKGPVAMNKLNLTGGGLAGSFHTYPTPASVFTDAGWPATILAGCASAGGLGSLTLSGSKGAW
jgi:hypothetical protein